MCPDELPVPEGELIVDELNQQARFATYRIGSKDAHSPNADWVASDAHAAFSKIDAENYDTAWPVHAVPGTTGFELLEGLPSPCNYDFFVWKGVELDMHPYGACYHDLTEKLSTGVIELLRSKNINTILIGGLALDICVKATAIQLAKASFTVVVNLAASRGLSEEATEAALAEFEDYNIKVISSTKSILSP